MKLSFKQISRSFDISINKRFLGKIIFFHFLWNFLENENKIADMWLVPKVHLFISKSSLEPPILTGNSHAERLLLLHTPKRPGRSDHLSCREEHLQLHAHRSVRSVRTCSNRSAFWGITFLYCMTYIQL